MEVDPDMSWWKRDTPAVTTPAAEDRTMKTEGLWVKCDGCRQPIFRQDLEKNLQVCPKCGYHFRIVAPARLEALLDEGYTRHDANLQSTDPIGFVDSKPYKQRLQAMQTSLGLRDAIVSASGTLDGRPVNLCVLELRFIGGSMGSVVGETIARAIDRSLATRHPLIVVSASGGARMQEGATSLMQMAKISAGLAKLDEAGIPYISVMTDPTTGGVTASFAMLGDLNLAEPGALIGFAGPRVIEQTIRQKLPEGFQRAEFLEKHGFVDAVVPRLEMKEYIAKSLAFMAG